VTDESEVAETTDESEGLVFDDLPKVVPVTINRTSGVAQYELREMNGEGLAKWMQILAGRAKRDKKGRPDVARSDFTKFMSSLLALCLWDKQTNAPVSKDVIDKWPSSIQTRLFAEARKMNGLDDEDGDSKNG
jgi:hypothetical protein